MSAASMAAKTTKPKPTHPTYLEMAKDAVTSLAEKKGSSVVAIVNYVAGKYNIDPDSVRQHLKPALAKGLDTEIFLRPKDSDAKGFTGRFKINKAKGTEEAKLKAKKEKEKLAKEKSKEKTAVKKAAAIKSPKKAAKGDKAKKVVKKSVVKKSPGKTKTAAEKKPKAAKATLKTPKKTPKKLKAKTPASASKKGKK